MDYYELWSPIVGAALTVGAYSAWVLSKRYQERHLRRFHNSEAAAHLYTFAIGVLAVTLPLGIFGIGPWYLNAALGSLPFFPLSMAEVVRSRADRRAKQQVPPTRSLEVTP